VGEASPQSHQVGYDLGWRQIDPPLFPVRPGRQPLRQAGLQRSEIDTVRGPAQAFQGQTWPPRAETISVGTGTERDIEHNP
jgi:hypothetical protein